MTDKVYTYIFQKLNQETAMLITRFPNDDEVLNDMYSEYLKFLEEDGTLGFINYLTQLMAYLETKEYYEKCSQLLKLKNKIKDLQK